MTWNDSSDRRGNFIGTLFYSFIVEYPFVGPLYRRGDADADGSLNIGDAIAILTYLFGPGSIPCLASSDVDDSGAVDISDAIGLLGYLFLGTLGPRPPFEECGFDDSTELGCDAFPPCAA